MKRPREANGPGYRQAGEQVEGAVFWQLVSGPRTAPRWWVGPRYSRHGLMGYGRPRGNAGTCPMDETMIYRPNVTEPGNAGRGGGRVVIPVSFQQRIDTSSWWLQKWVPQPLWGQSSITVSDPLQFTPSSQIGPVPGPYSLRINWPSTENLTNTQTSNNQVWYSTSHINSSRPNVAVICVPVGSYVLIFYIYYEVVLKVCIMFSGNATSGDFYSLFLF